MKQLELHINELQELPLLAKSILSFAGPSKIFAFYGDMGSGKTTLIKAISSQLGSEDDFSSPTYGIVNEYHTKSSEVIYHMDLYRLNSAEEALDAGVEEYLNSDAYCFIEWPQVVESLLPEDVVKLYITISDNVRNVSIFINHAH